MLKSKKSKLYLLIISILTILIVSLIVGLSTCNNNSDNPSGDGDQQSETVDYVSQLKLNMDSNTKKASVTVKQTVDGDTVHFYINEPSFDGTFVKARFIAVDTPESTGEVEPYGKKASNFTKERVKNATSIIIESDDENWNVDSTGGRYVLWIWYRLDENSEYRNLNLEILQEGLARNSSTSQNRYGETCLAALYQAQRLKLNLFSGQKDPDYYYGAALEITLKELRTNIEKYNGKRVAFEGVVYRNDGSNIYLEEYDPEDDVYYGIQIFGGYKLTGTIVENIAQGNRVRIVTTITYYETGGIYQGSDIKYRDMKPNDPDNTQFISSGHEGAFPIIAADDFLNRKIEIITTNDEGEEVSENRSLCELMIHSSISMQNLQVTSVYTTDNDESSSNGAMTLTCKVGNVTISVRTTVLRDADGNLITASTFQGKNINVKGMVDYYNGTYQIKVFSIDDVTFNN